MAVLLCLARLGIHLGMAIFLDFTNTALEVCMHGFALLGICGVEILNVLVKLVHLLVVEVDLRLHLCPHLSKSCIRFLLLLLKRIPVSSSCLFINDILVVELF